MKIKLVFLLIIVTFGGVAHAQDKATRKSNGNTKVSPPAPVERPEFSPVPLKTWSYSSVLTVAKWIGNDVRLVSLSELRDGKAITRYEFGIITLQLMDYTEHKSQVDVSYDLASLRDVIVALQLEFRDEITLMQYSGGLDKRPLPPRVPKLTPNNKPKTQ